MKITRLHFIALAVLLLSCLSFYTSAQCTPPLKQVVVSASGTASTPNYLFWKPSYSTPTLVYEVKWKEANNSVGAQLITPNDAIHSLNGFVGIKLPSGTNPVGLQASIFPQILNCGTHYTSVALKTAGDLITDNIDLAYYNLVKGQIISPYAGATELTDYANDEDVGCGADNVTNVAAYERLDPHEWLTDEAHDSKVAVNALYDETDAYRITQYLPDQKIKYYSSNYYWVNIICEDDPGNDHWFRWQATYRIPPGTKTGIFKETSLIVISPNPAAHSFTLNNVALKNEEVVTVTLHDGAGRIVRTWANLSSSNIENQAFDIGSLQKGVYILELQTETQVLRTKLVKSD